MCPFCCKLLDTDKHASQAAADPGAEVVTDPSHTEAQASAAVTPREVLDKLNAAKVVSHQTLCNIS